MALWLTAASCGGPDRPQSQSPAKRPALPAPSAVNAPPFNADSAYQFVEQQVQFGPRVPGTKAHSRAVDWMTAKLRQYGATVQEQRTNLKSPIGVIPVRNVVASFYPQHKRRIMLSAHYDTRPRADREPKPADAQKPFDGANDGASGVGVLLEIARQLQQRDPGIGVDIFLWDAEDLGESNVEDSYALGSQHWSRNKLPPGYTAEAGILLDMVGAQGATFTQESISRQYAPQVQQQVWQTAQALGYGNYFLFAPDVEVVDDHYYINRLANIPTIDIIHRDLAANDFFPCHHRLCDDMRNIDLGTLKAAGQTVLTYLYQLGAQATAAASPPSGAQ